MRRWLFKFKHQLNVVFLILIHEDITINKKDNRPPLLIKLIQNNVVCIFHQLYKKFKYSVYLNSTMPIKLTNNNAISYSGLNLFVNML